MTDRQKSGISSIGRRILSQAGELDFTYFSAVRTVENALAKVKDEKGMKRVEKFLKREVCPACGGTRLSQRARSAHIDGRSLADVCQMPLSALDGVGAHGSCASAGRYAADGRAHL